MGVDINTMGGNGQQPDFSGGGKWFIAPLLKMGACPPPFSKPEDLKTILQTVRKAQSTRDLTLDESEAVEALEQLVSSGAYMEWSW